MKPVVHVVNTASCYRVHAPLYIMFKNGDKEVVEGEGNYIEETVSMPKKRVRIVIQGNAKLIPHRIIKSMHHGNGTLFWRE